MDIHKIQNLIDEDVPGPKLAKELEKIHRESIFIITDENVRTLCLPLLVESCQYLSDAEVITIEPGDEHKNLESMVYVWRRLSELGATRSSLIINLGGGVVTDLGGFAASTFKRGLPYINIPTTLLGMVDAAVGGKTGINLGHLKNEVGIINNAEATVICSAFLKTLPYEEFLSGYGEMLKMSMLISTDWYKKLLAFDVTAKMNRKHSFDLSLLVYDYADMKASYVVRDPFETGIRKELNLGHTAGHAFETLALRREQHVPHGIAVAWGLVTALVLSNMICEFPSDILQSMASYIKEYYPAPTFTCDDYNELIELMRHDKKNPSPDDIFFVLLEAPGIPRAGFPTTDQIKTALDITRDLLQ